MIDGLLRHWNDILTVSAFLVAATTGYFQIRHYLAQSASLSILDDPEGRYKMIETSRGSQDGLEPTNTRYEVKLRVENDGRESTTISDAILQLDDTGEELELTRYEGSTQIRITGDGRPNMPSPSDAKMRIPGNDVEELQFRAEGNTRSSESEDVEGTIRLRTVGGDACEHSVTFST